MFTKGHVLRLLIHSVVLSKKETDYPVARRGRQKRIGKNNAVMACPATGPHSPKPLKYAKSSSKVGLGHSAQRSLEVSQKYIFQGKESLLTDLLLTYFSIPPETQRVSYFWCVQLFWALGSVSGRADHKNNDPPNDRIIKSHKIVTKKWLIEEKQAPHPLLLGLFCGTLNQS